MIIDPRKVKAIELMLEPDLKISDIAKEVGVSRQTLHEWIRQEDFASELAERRQEVKDLGNRMYASRYVEALKRYWKLIESTDNSETMRKALEYYIERFTGKIPSKMEISESTEDDKKDEHIIPSDFEQWKQQIKVDNKENIH